MPLLALFLLLISAALHALWNLLLKGSDEKYAAMGWQVIIGGALSLGALLFTGLPPRSMWLFALASATLEAIYFAVLTYAYNGHDFSLVYPMARGAAPALLVLWAALFLGEKPTPGGSLGIALIVAGIVVIGATSLLQNHEGKPHLKGLVLALTVAFIISVYTIIDGYAVKHGPSLPYALSMFVFVPFVTTPFLLRRYGWKHLAGAWRKGWARLLIIGLLGVVAYAIALFAYSFAPLNYSEAIREVSVVLGAFAGWHFLGEKMGGYRVLGAAVIFGGILLIAIYG
jgi:drug/metabolite transporter (DMT)-like permease